MPHRNYWGCMPILPFDSLKATCTFYTRLGFEVTYKQKDYVMLRKDQVELHCARTGHYFAGSPATCYLRSPDVDRLFENLDLEEDWILSPPEDRPWQMREFHLRDPFGNVLRFGQPATE